MAGLFFLLPHCWATCSGSFSLNSPFSPTHMMRCRLPLSVSSSNRNCHNWIWPLLPGRKKIAQLHLFVLSDRNTDRIFAHNSLQQLVYSHIAQNWWLGNKFWCLQQLATVVNYVRNAWEALCCLNRFSTMPSCKYFRNQNVPGTKGKDNKPQMQIVLRPKEEVIKEADRLAWVRDTASSDLGEHSTHVFLTQFKVPSRFLARVRCTRFL